MVIILLIYDGSNDKIAPITHRTVEVVSSNKISSGDHMTIRLSGRKDYSLFFVEKGKMTFDNTVLEKNQVWIYPPEVKQEYVVFKLDNTTYYYLHFTGNRLDELISDLKIPLKTPLDFPFDKEIFDKITKAISSDDALSKVKSEYLTLKLLSLLAHTHPLKTKENMMRRVLDEMRHSYFLPYDGEKFAQMCALSLSRFNHLFKDATGIPPQKYYNTIRMENASVLLKETKLSITEIAQKTGFSDPLYFGQTFKKFFGVPPSDYR